MEKAKFAFGIRGVSSTPMSNGCVCGDPNFDTRPFKEALELQVTLVAQNFQITLLHFSDQWLVAQGSSFCQGSVKPRPRTLVTLVILVHTLKRWLLWTFIQ